MLFHTQCPTLYAFVRPDWLRTARVLSTCPSVRLSVRLLPNFDILKTYEPILMPLGTSGPFGKGVRHSTLVVRRLNVNVTRDRRLIYRPGGGIIIGPLGRVVFFLIHT